jgi:hypothetical protein
MKIGETIKIKMQMDLACGSIVVESYTMSIPVKVLGNQI